MPTPYAPADFERLRVTDAWRKYERALTWGAGQTLAVLDDGFDLATPEWRAMEAAGKIAATFNAVEGGSDARPVGPAYHGTTVAYPSSLNHGGRCGVAFNNRVALVRCVTVVHLTADESPTMAAGLRWVIDHARELNITAVNLAPLDDKARSAPVPTAIDEPLARLRSMNIWVSAPCGNNEFTTGISWPACQDHCFGIGATKPDGSGVHRDRWENTDLVAPGDATSSSNAYAAASAMVLREAIEKRNYDWRALAPTLPEAILRLLRETGPQVHDPPTGLTFPQLDLLAALDRVMG